MEKKGRTWKVRREERMIEEEEEEWGGRQWYPVAGVVALALTSPWNWSASQLALGGTLCGEGALCVCGGGE